MNIYANKGSLVLVTKETAHNGYDSQKKDVEEYLQIGKLYTIHKTIVHSSSTEIFLDEFPDKSWNSVNFIDYVPQPKESDFMESFPDGKKELNLNVAAYEFAKRKWFRQNEKQIEARRMYKQGVTKLSETEFMVTGISAFDKDVNGCLRHKKHCMITFTKVDDKTIYDLFLDKDQTIRLQKQLDKILYGDEND